MNKVIKSHKVTQVLLAVYYIHFQTYCCFIYHSTGSHFVIRIYFEVTWFAYSCRFDLVPKNLIKIEICTIPLKILCKNPCVETQFFHMS